jgi:hypothetical protein
LDCSVTAAVAAAAAAACAVHFAEQQLLLLLQVWQLVGLLLLQVAPFSLQKG